MISQLSTITKHQVYFLSFSGTLTIVRSFAPIPHVRLVYDDIQLVLFIQINLINYGYYNTTVQLDSGRVRQSSSGCQSAPEPYKGLWRGCSRVVDSSYIYGAQWGYWRQLFAGIFQIFNILIIGCTFSDYCAHLLHLYSCPIYLDLLSIIMNFLLIFQWHYKGRNYCPRQFLQANPISNILKKKIKIKSIDYQDKMECIFWRNFCLHIEVSKTVCHFMTNWVC